MGNLAIHDEVRKRRPRWPLPLALVLASFGPALKLIGPDGMVSPHGYTPVGLFVVALFSPAFPFAVWGLPQYLLYAVPAWLLLRLVARR
jgi:hypothetical protein